MSMYVHGRNEKNAPLMASISFDRLKVKLPVNNDGEETGSEA